MSRLVALSHRVLRPDDATPHAGGLARAVQAAVAAHDGVWFGCEHGTGGAALAAHEAGYLGFSNDVLWPMLHGFALPDSEVPVATRYAGYCAHNRAWASALAPRLRATDLVWIHDYQLLPLGAALRDRGYRGRIGLFLHVPFPEPGQWRRLPMHRSLLRDLLACDLLGFQTTGDRDRFLDAVAATPGLAFRQGEVVQLVDGRRVRTGVYPVGVDVERLRARLQHAPSTALARYAPWLAGRRLVAGVERLDYTKALPQRIAAYAHWLRARPEAAAHTAFVQVAPPSRLPLPAYARATAAVVQAAEACNAPHRGAGVEPLLLVRQALPHDDVLALLAAARVACVTPLRDGMNLVAQEFVAVQSQADPGVLVLSRGAGAASTLTSALQVDGDDPVAISAALARALQMPLIERQQRLAALRAALRRHGLADWHTRFVADLARSNGARLERQRSSTRPASPAVTMPT
jgi:trehalose 6-phosphate synthase